ncbi:hypothetical protein BJX68DRAFT_212378 [Aspergillus pseudodeflectus]|uniref:Secreted protein n=1 Tax=Aspergillus pseudodeflectus TaxID=176178 RepID=A0ABR4JEN4_9EURO
MRRRRRKNHAFWRVPSTFQHLFVLRVAQAPTAKSSSNSLQHFFEAAVGGSRSVPAENSIGSWMELLRSSPELGFSARTFEVETAEEHRQMRLSLSAPLLVVTRIRSGRVASYY